MSVNFIDAAKDYASYHTRGMTKIIHGVGLVLIFFGLQIFFGFVQVSMPNVFSTDLAWLLSIALLVYYFKIQKTLAMILVPIFYVFNTIASFIAANGPNSGALESCFFLILFGLIAQFMGSAYEKNRAPFPKAIHQLFLSPLFLLAETFFYFSMMNDLYYKIYEIDQEAIERENKKRFEENNEESYGDSTVERRSKKREQ